MAAMVTAKVLFKIASHEIPINYSIFKYLSMELFKELESITRPKKNFFYVSFVKTIYLFFEHFFKTK